MWLNAYTILEQGQVVVFTFYPAEGSITLTLLNLPHSNNLKTNILLWKHEAQFRHFWPDGVLWHQAPHISNRPSVLLGTRKGHESHLFFLHIPYKLGQTEIWGILKWPQSVYFNNSWTIAHSCNNHLPEVSYRMIKWIHNFSILGSCWIHGDDEETGHSIIHLMYFPSYFQTTSKYSHFFMAAYDPGLV